MRVHTRHLLVDSAIALVLGWICFWGAHVFWDPPRPVVRSIRSARRSRTTGSRSAGGRPAGWRRPWLIVVVGLAVRRIWPRSASCCPGRRRRLSGGRRGLRAGLPRAGAGRLRDGGRPAAAPLGAADGLLVPMIMAGHWRSPISGCSTPSCTPDWCWASPSPSCRPCSRCCAAAGGRTTGDPRAGPAPVRLRGAAADRPRGARRGRSQPVGDHHAGRRRAARAGQAARPGGGVTGGDPDDQPRGPGRAADHARRSSGIRSRARPGSGARPGPARRPGRRAAQGGPGGRVVREPAGDQPAARRGGPGRVPDHPGGVDQRGPARRRPPRRCVSGSRGAGDRGGRRRAGHRGRSPATASAGWGSGPGRSAARCGSRPAGRGLRVRAVLPIGGGTRDASRSPWPTTRPWSGWACGC